MNPGGFIFYDQVLAAAATLKAEKKNEPWKDLLKRGKEMPRLSFIEMIRDSYVSTLSTYM